MSAEDVPSHIPRVECVLREWLADPGASLLCGRWADGGVMELLPEGRARLGEARYGGRFAGLRDLELAGEAHHLHLDLARLPCAVYLVAPSVCFGFRPSFEVRLCAEPDRAVDAFGVGLSLQRPYRGDRMDREAVRRYLRRLVCHQRDHAGVVSVRAVDAPVPEAVAARRAADWGALGTCLQEEFGVGDGIDDAAGFIAAVARAGQSA